MLEILNEHLNEINAKIAAVKTADHEAEIKAKVAAYEETVRAEITKTTKAELDKLEGIKLGIQYVIDAEAQKAAELAADEEERRTYGDTPSAVCGDTIEEA